MRHSLAFAFCVIAIIALCGITGSNASTSAQTAQNQHGQTIEPSFYGMTLGERGADVHARLGKPTVNIITNHGPTWAYSIQHDNAWLVVLFEQGVVASINVLPQAEHKARLGDPFGVHAGDSLERLTAVRGKAVGFADPNIYYYGQVGQPGWMYGLRRGIVSSIGVTSGETNVPAIIIDWRRDGIIPERAIVLHPRRGESVESQELALLNRTPCADSAEWQLLGRSKMDSSGTALDRVHVGCSVSPLEQTYFFKIVY
jgi:hypothetical protein